MPIKAKTSPEEKVQIVEACLGGEIGQKSAAIKLGVNKATIQQWISRYRSEGPSAFIQTGKNRHYTPEVKEAAVRDYLSGKGSLLDICQKYNHGCTRQAKNPQYVAENLLNRQFHATKPNEKWLTDVTELKWYEGFEVHKLYLSAILDLCDRRIVSYVLSQRNDNPLVYKTFDKAVKANPDAHPLFHSDRGFQYTSRVFHHKLQQAGMTQSMSRVAHCIDNGPMEGFWGILKRERYYSRRFTSKQELVQMIENYIRYYNTRRVQRNLGVLTPLEKHRLSLVE